MFDTLLDEQSILGLALGAGVSGLVPIPEIQYLAYLHNAEDQLRGEAASLSFFSRGRYRNGMVIRIDGYGYQKGFGGHFHNDNGVAVLRDIPGIVVASPARAADAAAMLRTCAAAAAIDGTVCVFLEPIALYATADLHEAGRRRLARPVRPAGAMGRRPTSPIGEPRRYVCRRRPAARVVGQRAAHVARVATRASPRRHRLPRARPALARAAAHRRDRAARRDADGCSWSTRPAAAAASAKRVVTGFVEAGFTGPHGARRVGRLVHPARRRRTPRVAR